MRSELRKLSHLQYACVVAVSLLTTACAGKFDYVPPSTRNSESTKTINKPRDIVWDSAIPALSREFFVINNLDKSSGLVNVSYTGDPERYVDCGRMTSFVKNAQGERTYSFNAASARQTYEVMNTNAGGLFFIDRRMALEGRINIVFEGINASSTKVTVSTRYLLTRNATVRSAAGGFPMTNSDSINFNSGGRGSFLGGGGSIPTDCVPTGALERQLLDLIQ